MGAPFAVLEERLKAACGRGPVYFLPNNGNWGDALIRQGTLDFLRDVGLHGRELTSRRRSWILPFLRGGTVLYGGGGAWCKLWNRSARTVARLASRFHVVVLPSTYELRVSIPRTTFFCRDLSESRQNMPAATFCHDMAFYIGRPSAPGRGSGNGYFFRRDRESAGRIVIPAANNDLSMQGDHCSDVSPFFDEIGRFAVIHTDRLHVAIAACLLEREVHLYPGAYFKNRAVYLASMQAHFPNAHFHPCATAAGATRAGSG